MKRPMCTLAVSWLAGLLLASLEIPVNPSIIIIIYFILVIFLLYILKKHPDALQPYIQKEWYLQFTVLLLMVPCLFLGGYFRMEQFTAKQEDSLRPWKLLEKDGERYVTVEGTVRSKKTEDMIILELKECEIIGDYGQENQPAGDCRIKLKEEGKDWLPEVFVGNKIRVFGKFYTYQPAGNPGQFDAFDYYSGKELYADVSALRITVIKNSKDLIGNAMFILRQRMRKSLATLYPAEKAGVLAAMILGDKDMLSEETEALYRQNGISHILAISGLHISMLCMGLFRMLRKLTVPVNAATVTVTGFLVFYIVFTGAGVSSLRAGIMCFLLLLAGNLRRSYDLLSSLSVAAIAVTALHPTEFMTAGFLLSFVAVIGVALAKEVEYAVMNQQEGKRPLWCIFLFGGMIQCVTIPVSLWFFYELSPYSIVWNLIVIPLVSLILGGGMISAVFGFRLPVGGTYILLEFYEKLCKTAGKLPFSFVLLGRPAIWQLVCYYVGLLVVIAAITLKKKKCIRLAGMALMITAIFFPGRATGEVLFLDVSQGDGTLITTKEGITILYDGGSSDVKNVGEYRICPVLKQKGILFVDMAVVSHLDYDHISGIKEILTDMPVRKNDVLFAAGYNGSVGIKELVLPLVQEKSEAYTELETLARKKNVAIRYIQAGDVLYKEKNLIMECLSPCDAKTSDNDTSLVFLLQSPKLLIWLMGDAGVKPEAELIKRLENCNMSELYETKVKILKVGHHGSKTSSGESFISFVQPDISVISCGSNNSYGHPHQEVTRRLTLGNSMVFRTDLQGAVLVTTRRNGKIRIQSWKEKSTVHFP